MSKVKTLEDKPRSVWPSFFKCVTHVIEKAVSICVINLQDRKVKKTSTSQYQSFEHNGMKIYDQQRLESLEEKKAAQMQTWCQKDLKLYSKGRPAGKLTWCEPSGDHLDYLWRENIQRTSPQRTGRAKAVTMLRLENCVFRHTLGVRTFYTSPLRKCKKTQRKTFWSAIFLLFDVKWITY